MKAGGAYELDKQGPGDGTDDPDAPIESRPLVTLDNGITYEGEWKVIS